MSLNPRGRNNYALETIAGDRIESLDGILFRIDFVRGFDACFDCDTCPPPPYRLAAALPSPRHPPLFPWCSVAKTGSTSPAECASVLIRSFVFRNVECSLDIVGAQTVLIPVYDVRCTVPGVWCKVFVSAALELLSGFSYVSVVAWCHLLASLPSLRIRHTLYVCSAVKTGSISPAETAMYIHSWICMITYD